MNDAFGKKIRSELIYEHDFRNGLDGWTVEGRAKVHTEDGKIIVDALGKEAYYSTIWCNKEFLGDLKVSFTACLLPPKEKNNINFFFLSQEADGGDVLCKNRENAEYKHYHSMQNYIFTCLNNGEDKTRIRMRKCPGFNLLHEMFIDEELHINVPYRFEIIRLGKRIVYAVNDEIRIRYIDDKPLTSGKMGFRTWRTKLYWNNFKVYRLKT